ncbi:Holliday junction branch migration protein RuvA [Aciduricibacillus chroicocephali]|uniref:Holliday junction branch migration complex subunit RuvA n=1 Tax=Aciduricibacillus chroicocephali TaxID=3054939 RepID=A0ABY9KSJ2_9BACI|nr:Holliday junction branch migration protein RuvA [Bacillaceae bacterium 44XB]
MIAYVKGKLAFITDDTVVLDVGGLGYEIFCANPYKFQNKLHQEMLMHTYQHVREDAITLFGFETEDEKYLFTKLISVSGIGPKSGIAILSGAEPNKFIAAVEQENEKFLTSFPGVGKKTARQIILDLKGKLSGLLIIGEENVGEGPDKNYDALNEAEEALQALGYGPKEIKAVMPELRKMEGATTDEMIRKALSFFIKN